MPKKRTLQSSINVTPFIDVMLVLLVVFIITAPLITSQLDLSLPQSHGPTVETKDGIITISMDRHGDIFYENKKTSLENLLSILRSIVKNNPQVQCSIEAHKSLSYEKVLSILDHISQLGLLNVSLITQTAHAS